MVGENATHDVRSLLGGLRDHLAQHDRPIAFLFGAGTSCAVRVPSTEDKGETVSLIPNIAGLTKSCEKAAVAQSEKFALAWQKIFLDCKDTKPTRGSCGKSRRVTLLSLTTVGPAFTT